MECLLKKSVAAEAVQLLGDHSILGSSANTGDCFMRNFTEIVTKKVQMFQKKKSKSKLPAKEPANITAYLINVLINGYFKKCSILL